MRIACETCRLFRKETDREGMCTLDPKWVSVRIDHFCGHHAPNMEELGFGGPTPEPRPVAASPKKKVHGPAATRGRRPSQ